MYRYLLAIGFSITSFISFSQRLITTREAVNLSLQSRINITPATLELQKQQLLLGSARIIDNPEIGLEKTPYEKLSASIQQRLRYPTVYSNLRALQNERIQLSKLLLQLNSFEIVRLIRTNYLEIQYFNEKRNLLSYQDSLYRAIKSAAQRNFEAGQINKLEELFAQNQADRVHNELNRTLLDLRARQVAFGYITNFTDTFSVEKLTPLSIDSLFLLYGDTLINNARQQVFQQQVAISRQQLNLQKAELLPALTAGALFPLQSGAISPFGYRVGLSIPIFFKQNRAQINAAKLGVQLAEAQRDREVNNLSREYRLALSNLIKEQQSLAYYNTLALQQSRDILETSLRLFQAGQISYIEGLRNIITAFETQNNYLETLRNYNQALIELKYLTGNL